jgi:hypothetical protein
MTNYILGTITGVIVTIGFWLINRWYWKSMYLAEKDYSRKVVELIQPPQQ